MSVSIIIRIREQILPITIVAVIVAIGGVAFIKMPPMGTPGGLVAQVLLLIAFCAVISIFPAIAIACGWCTGDKVQAILAGVLPFPVIYILGIIVVGSYNMVFISFPGTILFIVSLSVVCGLAGYCAAMRTKNYLALSIILSGIWLIIWLNAIN